MNDCLRCDVLYGASAAPGLPAVAKTLRSFFGARQDSAVSVGFAGGRNHSLGGLH